MKLVMISDTHERENEIVLPEGDILIHAGDITNKGSLIKLEAAVNWYKNQPHLHKIMICGNHDFCFENGLSTKARALVENAGIIYLEDSGITIDGINFWGSPIQPWFHNWAFNRQRGADIKKHWDKIPDDTHVLITHGPPYMIRDEAPRGFGEIENVGCADLLNRISDLNHLKVHIFGHIHNGYGITKIEQCSFVNASTCTERYEPTNKPLIVEIS